MWAISDHMFYIRVFTMQLIHEWFLHWYALHIVPLPQVANGSCWHTKLCLLMFNICSFIFQGSVYVIVIHTIFVTSPEGGNKMETKFIDGPAWLDGLTLYAFGHFAFLVPALRLAGNCKESTVQGFAGPGAGEQCPNVMPFLGLKATHWPFFGAAYK